MFDRSAVCGWKMIFSIVQDEVVHGRTCRGLEAPDILKLPNLAVTLIGLLVPLTAFLRNKAGMVQTRSNFAARTLG